MNIIESLMGTSKTPAQKMREHQRAIQRADRELGREKAKLEQQAKKLVIDIRTNAKNNQIGACKIMARDLVRTRSYIEKFTRMQINLQGVGLRIVTVRSNEQMAEAMKGATKAMGMMSRSMNLPRVQKIMMDFEKENSKMDMKEEFMRDAIDDALDQDEGETEEAESERILQAVLDEIGISVSHQLGETPTALGQTTVVSEKQQCLAVGEEGMGGVSPSVAHNLSNDFQARLDSLRKD